jgi:hypothetical protein
MKDLSPSPGTVSKILWHFTGGPRWNAKEQRQNKSPKPAEQAYNSLKSIIRTRELRVGQYKEVVKVNVKEPESDSRGRKLKTARIVPVALTASPVCCLSDIPIIHLAYHAARYGKFAIGYHREAVLHRGFNPVFYTLPDTRVVRSIYKGFTELKFINIDTIKFAAWDIETQVDELDSNEIDISIPLMDIDSEASDVIEYVKSARRSFQQFLAFVKTFNEDEFSSIYCEREWRSLHNYQFELDEIAMIVLPKKVGSRKFFERFIARDATSVKLPRSIPIVPWEDLVEH